MNPKILKMMRFKPTSYNQVSLDHMECIAEFFEDFCPIDKNKAKRMLRGSLGISMRYIQEYLDSFEAWGVTRTKAGTIELLVKDENKDVFVRGSGEPNIGNGMNIPLISCRNEAYAINGICNPLPGKSITISQENCGKCEQRVV